MVHAGLGGREGVVAAGMAMISGIAVISMPAMTGVRLVVMVLSVVVGVPNGPMWWGGCVSWVQSLSSVVDEVQG